MLILRDVIGWSARETAAMLGVSVVAVNSALQRARETLRDRLPERRDEWRRPDPDAHEQEVLARYMEACADREPARVPPSDGLEVQLGVELRERL